MELKLNSNPLIIEGPVHEKLFAGIVQQKHTQVFFGHSLLKSSHRFQGSLSNRDITYKQKLIYKERQENLNILIYWTKLNIQFIGLLYCIKHRFINISTQMCDYIYTHTHIIIYCMHSAGVNKTVLNTIKQSY